MSAPPWGLCRFRLVLSLGVWPRAIGEQPSLRGGRVRILIVIVVVVVVVVVIVVIVMIVTRCLGLSLLSQGSARDGSAFEIHNYICMYIYIYIYISLSLSLSLSLYISIYIYIYIYTHILYST